MTWLLCCLFLIARVSFHNCKSIEGTYYRYQRFAGDGKNLDEGDASSNNIGNAGGSVSHTIEEMSELAFFSLCNFPNTMFECFISGSLPQTFGTCEGMSCFSEQLD